MFFNVIISKKHVILLSFLLFSYLFIDTCVDTSCMISTPKDLDILGIDPSNFPQDIYILDNLSFIAHGYEGLLIYNISIPNERELIGSYSDGGRVFDVFIKDSLAFLADRDDGLEIINISNPRNPVLINKFTAENFERYISDLFIIDDLAFLIDYRDSLRIINATNPMHPFQISKCSLNNLCNNIFVANSFAYISSGSNGLEILNISDPFNPYKIANYSTEGSISNVFICKSFAYLTDYEMGLEVLDISNPENPSKITYLKIEGNLTNIFVTNQFAFTSNVLNELFIINIINPLSPKIEKTFSFGSTAIFVSNNFLYIVPEYNSPYSTLNFRVFDISNINSIIEIFPHGFPPYDNRNILILIGIIESILATVLALIVTISIIRIFKKKNC